WGPGARVPCARVPGARGLVREGARREGPGREGPRSHGPSSAMSLLWPRPLLVVSATPERELLMLPASFRAGVIEDVVEGASAWGAAVAAGVSARVLTDWLRQAGVMLRAGRRRLGDQRSAVIRPAPAKSFGAVTGHGKRLQLA